jgi:hypothetical protein
MDRVDMGGDSMHGDRRQAKPCLQDLRERAQAAQEMRVFLVGQGEVSTGFRRHRTCFAQGECNEEAVRRQGMELR